MSTPTPETDPQTYDPYYRAWDGASVTADMAHAPEGDGDWVSVAHARRLERERDALARWKTEMLSVQPPLQEIGVALGLPLGASINDKILPALQALQAENAAYKALLLDPYVFFAMQHKACRPWRVAHDAWLDRVEALTGWEPFDQIEQYRANESTQTK